MRFLIVMLSLLLVQDLAYKPKEEFDIKLDYQFKQRPHADVNSVNLNETRKDYERRTSTAMLPYLILKITLFKLQEVTRVRITNNKGSGVVNKKIADGSVIALDIGFTDDVKDRVTPHEYILTFLSAEKK